MPGKEEKKGEKEKKAEGDRSKSRPRRIFGEKTLTTT